MIHGEDDRVIKPAHGKALYEAHNGDKTHLLIPDTGHNDLWNEQLVYDGFYQFIDQRFN